MNAYALDSSTLIKLLRRKPDLAIATNFSNAILSGTEIIIPQFVHFEMLRGFNYVNAKEQEQAYRKFLVKYSIGRFNDETWEIAAKLYSNLRKSGWNNSDSDILIGAFCIENGYTLVTTNTKHFKSMPALHFIDWTL
jgi:predicted nucleic acid-binding protein